MNIKEYKIRVKIRNFIRSQNITRKISTSLLKSFFVHITVLLLVDAGGVKSGGREECVVSRYRKVGERDENRKGMIKDVSPVFLNRLHHKEFHTRSG